VYLGICHQREFLNSVRVYAVIGYWLLVIGYWLLVIGYWLLVIGYWLLVIGYWLLVICFGGEFWNDGLSVVYEYNMFDERLMSNERKLVQN
jgi:hypothetical protein